MRRLLKMRNRAVTVSFDYHSLNHAELVAYARSKGIPATSRYKRETILEKLEAL